MNFTKGPKRFAKNSNGDRFASHGIKVKDSEKITPPAKLGGVFQPSRDPPNRVDLRKYCSPVEGLHLISYVHYVINFT